MPDLELYLATQKRVREAIGDAKAQSNEEDNDRREEALDYFDGRDSKSILAASYTARYGYRLTKKEDNEEGEYYAYERGNAPTSIQAGLYQIAETGTLQRVVRSVASLFTQSDQSWSFVGEDGEQSEDATELLSVNRKAGGFLQELIRTDRVSVLLSSSALKITYYNGALKYQGGLGPHLFWIIWPTGIEDANGSIRQPDQADIEDAACVILQLTNSAKQSDTKKSRYAAYFGRSAEYPNGRYVTYEANSPMDIPVIGAPEANDYEDPSMGIANPLTALQNSREDGFSFCPFEYPFVVFYGQDVPRDFVFPETSFALYDNSLEMDLLQSRIMKAADSSARGSIAVTLEHGGVPPENPDEGICILREGQTRDIQSVPGIGSKYAQDVLTQAQLQLSTRYSVPGYEVMSDVSGAPESGVALAIRSQAKVDARQERINEHETAVDKIFVLERASLEYFGADTQKVDANVNQVWDPGTWDTPIDPAIKVQSIKDKLAAGFIDYVEAVRLSRGLSSRDEAKQVIEEMKADKEEYKDPVKEEAELKAQQKPNVLGKIKPRE